jgi:perosamine synthetase
MADKLALLGGKPIRTELFPAYNTIGKEEEDAAVAVIKSGNLSQFLGVWHEDFYGGPKVRAFESAWADYVSVKHAVTVNSNTSGLIAAMGAVGIQPGDEVIVSPYTMSASAIAPVVYGGVPVFADIDPNDFCLSAATIEKAITPRTKAILAVQIFGQSADMDPIMALAKKHNLKVVEDCAQAPGSTYHGRPVGSLADIGVFSLNYHKHIHTGEGGVLTTNSDELADRLRLIRNHGENVVGPMKFAGNKLNTWGFNLRMPEIEAAIGLEQLKKLPKLIEERIAIADEFTTRMRAYPGITPPFVRKNSKHVYYLHACKLDAQKAGLSRDNFVKAMKAELPSSHLRETNHLIGAGYVKPLYLQPIYQERISNCSFNCPRYTAKVNYEKGLCPTTERMHFEELFSHEFIRPGMSKADIDDVFRAVDKIFTNKDQLKDFS